MIDKEKVIKGLEGMIDYFFDIYRNDTDSYKCAKAQEYSDCAIDAIALLKEQGAKWIHREDLDFKDKLGCNHFHGMCENCGFIHDFIDGHTGQYKYCPQCGQAVKWE